jgi:hypothetical protein
MSRIIHELRSLLSVVLADMLMYKVEGIMIVAVVARSLLLSFLDLLVAWVLTCFGIASQANVVLLLYSCLT